MIYSNYKNEKVYTTNIIIYESPVLLRVWKKSHINNTICARLDSYNNFLNNYYEIYEPRTRFLSSLPLFTISNTLLTSILKRNNINEDDINKILDYKINLTLNYNNILNKTSLYDNIPSLTKKEFEILCLLMDKPNKVFSREVILSNIWNGTKVTDRTIDVNITRLRKKIEPYGKKIVTRLGYGYCFETQK